MKSENSFLFFFNSLAFFVVVFYFILFFGRVFLEKKRNAVSLDVVSSAKKLPKDLTTCPVSRSKTVVPPMADPHKD